MSRWADVRAQAEPDEFAAWVDEDEWADLAGRGRSKRFPRGAYLLIEGSVSDVVYVLTSGRVKIVANTADGTDVLLALRGPGTLLGEHAVLDQEPRSASVVSIDPVEALVVPAASFSEFLLARPRVTLALLRALISRIREGDRRRAEFGSLDTVSRTALRLVELAERFGAPESAGVRITVPITQDELASWVGASREAVVKALRTLRSRGWIETERRAVVIQDLDALRRRAGTD